VNLILCISLANGISQEKEKDFPIIWEVFLGDGYGDLNCAEGCQQVVHNRVGTKRIVARSKVGGAMTTVEAIEYAFEEANE